MTDIKYTFLEYLDYWYQSIYSPYVGESRRCVYAWALYNIIYPSVIQDVLLNKITANYINELLDRCKDYCLSAAPVSKGLIRIALHDAEIDRYITYNPIREVKNYTWKKPIITIFSKEQMKKFLAAAYHYDNLYLEILLGLFCGLRNGEVRGLKYEDFDYENQTITISRQRCSSTKIRVVKSKAVYEGRERYFSAPKTPNSYRTLKVPEIIFQELDRRKNINQHILASQPDKKAENSEYVSISTLGNISADITLTEGVKKIAKQASIFEHVTFHSLRHIFICVDPSASAVSFDKRVRKKERQDSIKKGESCKKSSFTMPNPSEIAKLLLYCQKERQARRMLFYTKESIWIRHILFYSKYAQKNKKFRTCKKAFLGFT